MASSNGITGRVGRSLISKRQKEIPANDLTPHSPRSGQRGHVSGIDGSPDQFFSGRQCLQKGSLHGPGQPLTPELRFEQLIHHAPAAKNSILFQPSRDPSTGFAVDVDAEGSSFPGAILQDIPVHRRVPFHRSRMRLVELPVAALEVGMGFEIRVGHQRDPRMLIRSCTLADLITATGKKPIVHFGSR